VVSVDDREELARRLEHSMQATATREILARRLRIDVEAVTGELTSTRADLSACRARADALERECADLRTARGELLTELDAVRSRLGYRALERVTGALRRYPLLWTSSRGFVRLLTRR
jgi:hypothetical protein